MTIDTQSTPPLSNGHNTWYTSGQVKDKYGLSSPHIAKLGRAGSVTRRTGTDGYYEYLKHSLETYLSGRKAPSSSKKTSSSGAWVSSVEALDLLTVYPASARATASKALSNGVKRGHLERRREGSNYEYQKADIIRFNKTIQPRTTVQAPTKPTPAVKSRPKTVKETAKALSVDGTQLTSARSYNQAWWLMAEELKAKKFLTLDIFWVMVKERFG